MAIKAEGYLAGWGNHVRHRLADGEVLIADDAYHRVSRQTQIGSSLVLYLKASDGGRRVRRQVSKVGSLLELGRRRRISKGYIPTARTGHSDLGISQNARDQAQDNDSID